MPRLAICLLTYARTEYAKITLRSTLRHLKYEGHLHVHIADDGSDPEHVKALRQIAIKADATVTTSNSERGGYGRNVNLATQVIHNLADYVLMLEDDWELLRELDADVLLRDFAAEDRIQSIRLGYLSFTQRLYGEVICPRESKYLLLDSSSPEPHVFAGHPRIERVSYQRRVGMWPEGLLPGQTEFAMAHCLSAREGIAWPMDLLHPRGDLYAHIGTERAY